MHVRELRGGERAQIVAEHRPDLLRGHRLAGGRWRTEAFLEREGAGVQTEQVAAIGDDLVGYAHRLQKLEQPLGKTRERLSRRHAAQRDARVIAVLLRDGAELASEQLELLLPARGVGFGELDL